MESNNDYSISAIVSTIPYRLTSQAGRLLNVHYVTTIIRTDWKRAISTGNFGALKTATGPIADFVT